MAPQEERPPPAPTRAGRRGAPPPARGGDTAGLAPARRAVLALGNAVSLTGATAFVVSAGIMVVLWFQLVLSWMGPAGIPVALLTAPTGALYPFVHWVVTDAFPALYFTLWVLGLAGMAISMAWAVSLRRRVAPLSAASPRAGS
jgi:hypothetical protein